MLHTPTPPCFSRHALNPARAERHRIALSLLALCLLGTTGCVSHRQPPTAEVRSHFGPIRVIASANTPFVVEMAGTKSDLGSDWVSVSGGYERGAFNPFGIATTIAAIPVAFVAGRTYGIIAGEHDEIAEASSAALRRTTAGFRFENLLSAKIVSLLEQQGIAATNETTSTPQTKTVPALPHQTTLKLSVFEPGLKTEGGALRFTAHVSLQVIDPRRGEIYYDYLEYHGTRGKSASWLAGGPEHFQAKIEAAATDLATEFVNQVFLREKSDPSTKSRLSTLGITRREP